VSTPITPSTATAPSGPKTIDFAKPFTFAFEDPEWLQKVGIALAVFFASAITAGCLVGLAGFAVLFGYMKRVADRAIQRQPGLPDWDSWEDDLREGSKLLVAALVYALPGALVLAFGYVLFIIGAAAGGGDQPPTWAMAVLVTSLGLGMLLLLVGMIGAQIAVVRIVDTGKLGAAFHPGEMIRYVRANFVNLLLLFVVSILAGFAAQAVGLLLCVIGVFFTRGFVFLAQGNAIGQVIQADRATRATSSAAVFG